MTISASHPAFSITPDFTPENDNAAAPQGIPALVAGTSKALTLGFESGEVGKQGARVRVQSMLMEDANLAMLRARRAVSFLRNSNDSAALLRAQAAFDRRALELKQAAARTLDAYGIALDESNNPYVIEDRYPALLNQVATRQNRRGLHAVEAPAKHATVLAAAA